MTHKYKVELQRNFRGHHIPVNRPEYFEVGANTPDRTIISKAKAAFGFAGLKSNKRDCGDTIFLRFKVCSTHRLSIQFCH